MNKTKEQVVDLIYRMIDCLEDDFENYTQSDISNWVSELAEIYIISLSHRKKNEGSLLGVHLEKTKQDRGRHLRESMPVDVDNHDDSQDNLVVGDGGIKSVRDYTPNQPRPPLPDDLNDEELKRLEKQIKELEDGNV